MLVFVEGGGNILFFLQFRFFPLARSRLGSPPPRGSYFFLDEKVTKNQGLELMSDKLVETLFATAARNEEKSFLPRFWLFRWGKGCAQVSTASPSIISYASSRVQMAGAETGIPKLRF